MSAVTQQNLLLTAKLTLKPHAHIPANFSSAALRVLLLATEVCFCVPGVPSRVLLCQIEFATFSFFLSSHIHLLYRELARHVRSRSGVFWWLDLDLNYLFVKKCKDDNNFNRIFILA
jgi:hypothetical protein